jgi:hypothetical protein
MMEKSMKASFAAAAMIFLAAPAFAQDAAPPAPHDHAAPSQPAAPGSASQMPKTGMKPGMKMMEHCKMMQQNHPDKKGMDCHAMHEKMHGTGPSAPGQ